MRLDSMSTDALADHMRAAHRCAMRVRSNDVAAYFAGIARECLDVLQARERLRQTVADMFTPFTNDADAATDAIAAFARAFTHAGPSCQVTNQDGGTDGGDGGSKVRRRPRKPLPSGPANVKLPSGPTIADLASVTS